MERFPETPSRRDHPPQRGQRVHYDEDGIEFEHLHKYGKYGIHHSGAEEWAGAAKERPASRRGGSTGTPPRPDVPFGYENEGSETLDRFDGRPEDRVGAEEEAGPPYGYRPMGGRFDEWDESRGFFTGPHRGKGPIGYRRSDERIFEDVCERLTEDGRIDASGMYVSVQDGMVHLEGEAPTAWEANLAEDVAMTVLGVRDVINDVASRSAP